MPSLYLSAARADAALAGRLRDALVLQGVDRVAAALGGLVVLASPAGLASSQLRADVQPAIDRGHAETIAVITCGLDPAALAERWPELAALGCHPLPLDPTEADLAAAAGFCAALLQGEVAGREAHGHRRTPGRDAAAVETQGSIRDVASAKRRLAMGLMARGAYEPALELMHAVRVIFEQLAEPDEVADCWYRTGSILEHAGQLRPAEAAYERAVEPWLRTGARLAAAQAMSQLARLAALGDRPADAVAWYRRAVPIQVDGGHRGDESRTRSQLAGVLLTLQRHAEAHQEAHRAIGIAEALGMGAEPWKTWDVLRSIAQARGAPDQARAARSKAIDWYRRYRAQGGLPQPDIERPFALAHDAVLRGDGPAWADRIERDHAAGRILEPARPLWRTLAAFARGRHDAVRAALDTLHYINAVEFERLLAGRWAGP